MITITLTPERLSLIIKALGLLKTAKHIFFKGEATNPISALEHELAKVYNEHTK